MVWGWLARKDSNLGSPDPESGELNRVCQPIFDSARRLAPSESGSVRRTLPEESCALQNSSVNQANSRCCADCTTGRRCGPPATSGRGRPCLCPCTEFDELGRAPGSGGGSRRRPPLSPGPTGVARRRRRRCARRVASPNDAMIGGRSVVPTGGRGVLPWTPDPGVSPPSSCASPGLGVLSR